MTIIIKTIPHKYQRYSTVGDWFFDDSGDLQIRVSDLGDDKMNAAIALHEMAEALMCKANGVSQKEVDDFDMQFEAQRQEGNLEQPGDNVLAPYFIEHGVASGIERIFAAEMGIDWNAYTKAIEALP